MYLHKYIVVMDYIIHYQLIAYIFAEFQPVVLYVMAHKEIHLLHLDAIRCKG